jgi:flagellar biosynthesis chaperone FliJ
MALTEEIQAQTAAHQAAHQAMEDARREHEANMDRRRAKLELLRMAKETLVENARNKPVEEAGITAAEIAAFAEELTQYVGD